MLTFQEQVLLQHLLSQLKKNDGTGNLVDKTIAPNGIISELNSNDLNNYLNTQSAANSYLSGDWTIQSMTSDLITGDFYNTGDIFGVQLRNKDVNESDGTTAFTHTELSPINLSGNSLGESIDRLQFKINKRFPTSINSDKLKDGAGISGSDFDTTSVLDKSLISYNGTNWVTQVIESGIQLYDLAAQPSATEGNYIVATVANLTDAKAVTGISDLIAGECAIFHGGSWQKLTDTNSITSTMGSNDGHGNFTSTLGDYTQSQINTTTSSLSDLSKVSNTPPTDGQVSSGMQRMKYGNLLMISVEQTRSVSQSYPLNLAIEQNLILEQSYQRISLLFQTVTLRLQEIHLLQTRLIWGQATSQTLALRMVLTFLH